MKIEIASFERLKNNLSNITALHLLRFTPKDHFMYQKGYSLFSIKWHWGRLTVEVFGKHWFLL